MFTLKAENIKADSAVIHFKQWNVKINSVLSVGSVIFTYEYEQDGKTKTEKYKSTLNGITVKEIFSFTSGQLINTETDLLTYEKCTHPVMSNDMCAVCGEDLRIKEIQKTKKITPKNESFRMVSIDPTLKVDQSVAHDIAKKDLIHLVKNRRLVLLADLDHTLIHTTHEHVNPDIKDVHHYELQRNFWYHTKFRPGCLHFLQEMSKLYELHIVTFGERNYAHKIASLMDPERRFFHDRILSRNEIFNRISKSDNLRSLFPRGDLMVCIIDDREEVWNYARNLICVQPYVFFKNTGDINDPALFNVAKKRKIEESGTSSEQTKESVEKPPDIDQNDTDDYLVHLENILRKVHDEYYRIYESRLNKHENPINEDVEIDESDLPDVKKVLPLIKAKVLENCVITFSGVVPTGYDLRKQRCYIMATSLGAQVNENLILAEDESELEPKDNKNTELEYNFDENDSRSSCSGATRSDESSDHQKSKKFTTHLVAAKYGTSKVHDALKSKISIKVVTPEWLINCNYKWIPCDEESYKLTKDYDYKNCLFHHEYNMHQKYSSTNKNLKSISEVQSVEAKLKRTKSDGQAEISTKELINEELFSLMDKEVNEELSDSSTDIEQSDEEKSDKEQTDTESETSGPIDSDDSFDDKFAFDLERDLLSKNSE
ncbi:RNA polymerase II subunit A C-terminal domain phosphatase [Brachionus plicatilis]|uniref:RNA polymerase II subunit A C-terminal domain phosphatase n=1 Tax=Brachionus plicatilis TaxID=10195 RepID=A0A3M7QJ11_BRAPC|nr:RNA polymerase II subunit A C-terminal domain phosphatase [Brachionus plicatilis]